MAALALMAAACSTTGTPTAVAPSAQPQPAVHKPLPDLAPADRVEEAISRLRSGQEEQARVELLAALAVEPDNKSAKTLLRAMDTDPKALLGEKSYAYTVRRGETLWALSKRLLGDPLMFYALARYNQIEVPENLAGGAVLQIPGEPKKVVATPARRPAARTASTGPAADPAQAGRLRRTALEHMNRGRIDQAEALLQQASALDPDNATIRADLDRARRIQASVR